MDATSIFMDELEKIAISGTSLGRQIRTPSARSGMTDLLKNMRAGFSPAGDDPAKQRVLLAHLRGSMSAIGPKKRESLASFGTRRIGPALTSQDKATMSKALIAGKRTASEQVDSELGRGNVSKKWAKSIKGSES